MSRVDRRAELQVFDGSLPDMRSYSVGMRPEPIGQIDIGEVVAIKTLDASGDQIRPDTREDEVAPESLFPITGPVFVRGVRAGDAVGVRILEIELRSQYGHIWTRPKLGWPAEHVRYAVSAVSLARPCIPLGKAGEVTIPLVPHVGTVGVSPRLPSPARDLGHYGGNIDTAHLGQGATLWLTSQVDGAMTYIGDAHAAIGAGELCGTGVEAPAEVTLQVRRVRGWAPECPTVVTKDHRVWIIGVGGSIEAALHDAVSEVLRRLADSLDASKEDVYLAASSLLEMNLCQLVNPRVSVAVSLVGGLDRWLVPREVFLDPPDNTVTLNAEPERRD